LTRDLPALAEMSGHILERIEEQDVWRAGAWLD
jgi:hypothetical protein